MTELFVLGATGKTGSHVVKLIQSSYQKNFTLTDSIESANAVIEFSNPDACLTHIKKTTPSTVWVIASTGWTKSQEAELERLSQDRLFLKSSNFSLGIAELNTWLSSSAGKLHRLGFKVTVIETHHTQKKDSPSGTALTLKSTLEKSGFKSIPIESIREGDAVGTHRIRFESDGEVITLEHEAKDRSVFAQGAIEAAQWLAKLKKKNPSQNGLLSLHEFMQSNTT